MIKSFPFNAVYDANGVPDRAYLAEDFARYFAKFIGTGVYPNPATGLQVVAIDNNMQIRIKKGDGYILGRDFENTDDYIIQLDVADGVLSRIDRVVLRLDYLKRDIIPVLKKGNYASSPIAPALQRDADAYEIAIGDVYVKNGAIKINQSDITDTRLNKELCGIVHAIIQQVDTTEIFRQFQAWFNEQKNVHEGDFEKWLNEFKIITGKKFTDWVDDLKNSLDPNEDIAAQLQMQISTVKSDLADITTYQTAGGTATSINLNLPTLVNGYATTFIVSSNNNKNATTINGKKLYKPNTTTTPNLTAGKAVSVWYNATKDCFFIKASAEGNAIAENVLAGKTFSNDDDTGIAGTMPNRGTFNLGFGATVPAGYYSGGIVPNGKRWACGELSVTINTDRIMSVTGLSFTPSKVIVSCYKYSGSPYTDSLNLIISNIADIYNMYGSFTDHSGDEITSHGEKIKSRIITRGFNVYLPKIGDGGNLKYWAYE
ncbi:hypothetical protein [Clostridium botulinum]|uniref:hypothetical protein n=1 Tax=Clostridium botulinum TaxID=1491 RepID=UPI00016B9CCC|nr:hypothetical protein [Clostridium botulinum]EDT84649.1 conserved domain protein [Clostridium botulinum Bf]